MSKKIHVANITNTLHELRELIEENKIHHVPIVSGNKVIGMITSSDIMRISYVSNYDGGTVETSVYDALSVEQVMSKDIQTVSPDITVREATEIFTKNNFHALPVVDGDNIVGIITTKDILKFLLDQF